MHKEKRCAGRQGRNIYSKRCLAHYALYVQKAPYNKDYVRERKCQSKISFDFSSLSVILDLKKGGGQRQPDFTYLYRGCFLIQLFFCLKVWSCVCNLPCLPFSFSDFSFEQFSGFYRANRRQKAGGHPPTANWEQQGLISPVKNVAHRWSAPSFKFTGTQHIFICEGHRRTSFVILIH